MRVLIIGDVHLADRPPSIRKDSYAEEIIEKLEFCVRRAWEMKCDAIVQAGDLFHIKAPTRTSHALVQRVADVLRSPGLPVYIVPGNHDMQHDRLESLKKQPLGTLAKVAGIDLLMGPHKEFPLFGLPYLHDWVTELPKWMRKYREWADAHKAESMEFYPLLVTHAPLFPKGQEPPYDFIAADDWAELQLNGDCYYGHIHDPHGTFTDDRGAITFCNQGALSRGSLHELTLKRKPAVTVWDSEKDPHFERIEVPHKPAEDVFRLKEKEDVDAKQERVEEFLVQIGQTSLDGLSTEEVVARAKEAELKPRTRELLMELLEAV